MSLWLWPFRRLVAGAAQRFERGGHRGRDRVGICAALVLVTACASGGQVERVEETRLSGDRASAPHRAAADAPVADTTSATHGEAPPTPTTTERAPPRERLETIYRSELDAFLQRGPGYLLAGVPVRPAKDARGRLVGFEIVEVFGEPRMARRDGVRAGDVLLRAQGRRVVTPDDLIAVYASLRTSPNIELDVLRGGQVVQLRWPILDLGASPAP
jgi:hypothetical protein